MSEPICRGIPEMEIKNTLSIQCLEIVWNSFHSFHFFHSFNSFCFIHRYLYKQIMNYTIRESLIFESKINETKKLREEFVSHILNAFLHRLKKKPQNNIYLSFPKLLFTKFLLFCFDQFLFSIANTICYSQHRRYKICSFQNLQFGFIIKNNKLHLLKQFFSFFFSASFLRARAFCSHFYII